MPDYRVESKLTGDTYRAVKQRTFKGCVIDGKLACYIVQSDMVGGYKLNTFYCAACFEYGYKIKEAQIAMFHDD
jgi:hypothetical protein